MENQLIIGILRRLAGKVNSRAAAGTCRKIKKRHGRLTIAVGRNLNDRGLADDEIDYLFANDLVIALQICQGLYPSFASFTPARQAALISMAFNLGKPRLAGFRRMRAVINRGNWQGAADEAENSLWARQARHRATDIAVRLRGVHKP